MEDKTKNTGNNKENQEKNTENTGADKAQDATSSPESTDAAGAEEATAQTDTPAADEVTEDTPEVKTDDPQPKKAPWYKQPRVIAGGVTGLVLLIAVICALIFWPTNGNSDQVADNTNRDNTELVSDEDNQAGAEEVTEEATEETETEETEAVAEEETEEVTEEAAEADEATEETETEETEAVAEEETEEVTEEAAEGTTEINLKDDKGNIVVEGTEIIIDQNGSTITVTMPDFRLVQNPAGKTHNEHGLLKQIVNINGISSATFINNTSFVVVVTGNHNNVMNDIKLVMGSKAFENSPKGIYAMANH